MYRVALTPEEQSVRILICRGLTDMQIAHTLGVDYYTVGNIVRSLRSKLIRPTEQQRNPRLLVVRAMQMDQG